jgi:beta-lactam-binding protein with PASTA domain
LGTESGLQLAHFLSESACYFYQVCMRTLFFCAIPFICCLGGYMAMSYMINMTDVIVPNVVGCSLSEALLHLSEMQLYGHIIAEQEDGDIAVETIIEQIPIAGYQIKTRQSVGLLVVKKPKKLVAFHAVGKELQDILKEAERLGIRIKIHKIGVEGAIDTCYAQYPHVGQEIADEIMHIYIIKRQDALCMMPNFKGYAMAEVRSALAVFGIGLRVFHGTGGSFEEHDCSSCIVIDQKPASGELIDKKNIHTLYIHVSRK